MKSIRSHAGRLLLAAGLVVLLAAGVMVATTQHASAISSYRSAFRNQYPATAGSALDSCTLCHTSGSPSNSDLNGYANDYAGHSYSFTAIESLDSDADGYTNIAEISALTFPGNAASHPGGGTATATVAPPTPGPSSTPVPTGVVPTPPATSVVRRGIFLGIVENLPGEHTWLGDWRVSGRTVRVTASTWIDHSDLLGEHAQVWVFGARHRDGSVDATYIRVLQRGHDDDD